MHITNRKVSVRARGQACQELEHAHSMRTSIDPTLLAALQRDAGEWLQSHHPNAPRDPHLDGRWHYLDPSCKAGYKGRLQPEKAHWPLDLVIHSFAHGGQAQHYDARDALKRLRQQRPRRRTPAPARSPSATTSAGVQADERARRRNVERELAHWQQLPEQGYSPYLAERGLPHLPGARYGRDDHGDYLALLIQDADGEQRGLQRIYPDGRKRFTWGLHKRGGFVRIPADPTLQRAHAWSGETLIVEGAATGLTAHLASGAEILIALDAGNLHHVAASMRPHRAHLAIVADHDHATPGNPGRTHAERAANAHHTRLITLEHYDLGGGTDLDDLRRHQDNQQVRRALQPAPLSPYDTVISSPYLHPFTPTPGAFVIRSPLGSGKTHALAASLNHTPRVLYLTHLVALARAASSRLHLSNYQDLDPEHTHRTARVAITINSLTRYGQHLASLEPFDVVVIDESEQLLRRLTTDIPNKALILSILRYLVRSARTVIALDAHAGRLTIDTMNDWRDQHAVTLRNDHPGPHPKHLHLHHHPDDVLELAHQTLNRGETVFLACNSRAGAERAHALLTHHHPNARAQLITSATSADPTVRDFFQHPNAAQHRYDLLIASPALATGVSIDHDHYDLVAGIFEANITTATDAHQALGRVRRAHDLHVHISPAVLKRPSDPDVIRRRWIESAAFERELLSLDHANGTLGFHDPHYERLYLRAKTHEAHLTNHLKERFLELAREQSYRISKHAPNPDRPRHTRQARTLRSERHRTAIRNAPDISASEADDIRHASRRTSDQHHALERHDLLTYYRSDPNHLDSLLELDQDGATRPRIERLERTLNDRTDLAADISARNQQRKTLRPDTRRVILERETHRKILAAVGLTPTTLKRLIRNPNAAPPTHSYDSHSIRRLVTWLERNYTALAAGMRLPARSTLKSNPIRFIGTILRKLGLRHQRTGRNAKGRYRIDPTTLSTTLWILRQRSHTPPTPTPLRNREHDQQPPPTQPTQRDNNRAPPP